MHADVTERLFRLPARSLISFSRNATGFDQDNAAGLAAERAFDYHLLKKRMLLEAAACKCTLQMQTSARPLQASLSPRLLKRLSLPSSRLLCLPLSGAASLPAVLERLLPATPAVGPLSSESRV